MKKLIALSLFSILLVSCSGNKEEKYASGKIENGDFENKLDYWYGNNIKSSNQITFNGNSSLELTSTSTDEAQVYQTIKDLPNGYYYLQVQAYHKGDEEYCYVYANTNDNTEYKTMVPRYIHDNEWMNTTVRGIHVTDGQLTIGIRLLGNNTAYFDEFNLFYEKNQKTQYPNLQGGCISWLDWEEDMGAKYYNYDNEEEDCLKILSDNGLNFVRLELYNDPGSYKDEEGNYLPAKYKNPDSIFRLAQRASSLNMDIELSFMYSSYWGNYAIPSTWINEINEIDDFDQKIIKLGDLLYDWTYSYLIRLKEAGITPKYVSLGNEIDDGILLPYGSTVDHPSSLSYLLNKGYQAVKDASNESKVVIHLGCNASDLHWSNKYGGGRWFFDILKDNNVNYDVIGTSFYPFWAQSDNEYASKSKLDLNDLKLWCEMMIDIYDKDILIMESGYNWGTPGQLANNGAYQTIYPSSPKGQRDYVINLLNTIKSVKDGRCVGSLYWDPVLVRQEGIGWAIYDDGKVRDNCVETTTFFDFSHKALPVLNAYKYNATSIKK
ncbi:MAG: glycosyl hydrolase 53 family protein [Bacilli bacterium]